MTLLYYGQHIHATISTIRCHAPEDTTLGKAGATVYAMVRAYAEDGCLFLRQGDPVNAVAAFGYAEGWLEGGIYLGLVSAQREDVPESLSETLDLAHQPRLVEKVYRYRRLLTAGIRALEPAPDEASILHTGCEEILTRAEEALRQGSELCTAGMLPDALRRFGYGHGWLDLGARTGLFRIIGPRHLFTI
jgi:hypothetical protein